MRSYKADLYLKLVENTDNLMLKHYMNEELSFILSINDLANAEVIEIGAGYGRLMNRLHNKCKSYTGIEINPDMYWALKSKMASNSKVVNQDIFKFLADFSVSDEHRTIFIIAQNTLGTLEGDYSELLKLLKQQTRQGSFELILSFFNAPALNKEGVSIYKEIEKMVGKIDFEKTNFTDGVFVSTTGYTSKWWKEDEIADILKKFGAVVVKEKREKLFTLLHLKLAPSW